MFSSGCGCSKRLMADHAMATAATMIKVPSTPLEKYSALAWPYSWSASGGRSAMMSIHSAISAATRLTSDSTASDSSPTEPVSQ